MNILRKLFPAHVRVENIFFMVVAVIVAVLLIVVMARTNERHSAFECHWPSHIVKSGDTMWMIDRRHLLFRQYRERCLSHDRT